jgi:hypothetical protein
MKSSRNSKEVFVNGSFARLPVFVCFFGARIATILFLGVECHVDFPANWAFLIHANPSSYKYITELT